MALIPVKETKFIRDHFAKNLKGEVTIDYFTQGESPLSVPIRECAYCKETGELLREIDGLSDKIRLRVHDLVAEEATATQMQISRIPAFVLGGAARGRVRFFGIPSGYEFPSVIEAIVDVGNGTTDLSPRAREELSGLQKDIHIQVFGTPT